MFKTTIIGSIDDNLAWFSHIQSGITCECICQIIFLGKPDGPTCHTGEETCYYTSVYDALNNPQVSYMLFLKFLARLIVVSSVSMLSGACVAFTPFG